MHRVFADIETIVTAVKLTDDRIMLTSKEPVLLNASSLGMLDGVELLRYIANLPVISLAVPVTFQLQFQKAS